MADLAVVCDLLVVGGISTGPYSPYTPRSGRQRLLQLRREEEMVDPTVDKEPARRLSDGGR